MRSAEDEAHEITKRIRDARKESGRTTRDVGAQADLSHALVASIEAGKSHNLTIVQALRLGDALGLSRRWLLFGEGARHAEAAACGGRVLTEIKLPPPRAVGERLALGGEPDEQILATWRGEAVYCGRRGDLIGSCVVVRITADGELTWGVP